MSVTQRLTEIATEIADQLEGRTRALEGQLEGVKAQAAKIEAELNAAKFSRDRLLHFSPTDSGKYQCPRCWITDEVRAVLTPMNSADEDRFRCRRCHLEIALPF